MTGSRCFSLFCWLRCARLFLGIPGWINAGRSVCFTNQLMKLFFQFWAEYQIKPENTYTQKNLIKLDFKNRIFNFLENNAAVKITAIVFRWLIVFSITEKTPVIAALKAEQRCWPTHCLISLVSLCFVSRLRKSVDWAELMECSQKAECKGFFCA